MEAINLTKTQSRIRHNFEKFGKKYAIFFAHGFDNKLNSICANYGATEQELLSSLDSLYTIIGNTHVNGNMASAVKEKILMYLSFQENIVLKKYQILAHYSYWIKEIYESSDLKDIERMLRVKE